MKQAGYNYSRLAKALGIGRSSLWRRVTGAGSFTAEQLLTLQLLLRLNSPLELYTVET